MENFLAGHSTCAMASLANKMKVSRFAATVTIGLTVTVLLEVEGTTMLCSEFFHAIGDGCYKLGKDPLPWSEGELYCESIGSQLATFDSDGSYSDAVAFFRGLGMAGVMWIGYHDITQENKFMAVDSILHSLDIKGQWAKNRPDNAIKACSRNYAGGENCVAIEKDKLEDGPCQTKHRPLCKLSQKLLQMPELSPIGSSCPPFYTFANHRCYKATATAGTQDSVLSECKDDGGDLASFQSEEDLRWAFDAYIGNLAPAPNAFFWLGLVDSGAGFRWTDGTTSSYRNWGLPSEEIAQSKATCAIVACGMKWSTEYCSAIHRGLCAVDPVLWTLREEVKKIAQQTIAQGLITTYKSALTEQDKAIEVHKHEGRTLEQKLFAATELTATCESSDTANVAKISDLERALQDGEPQIAAASLTLADCDAALVVLSSSGCAHQQLQNCAAEAGTSTNTAGNGQQGDLLGTATASLENRCTADDHNPSLSLLQWTTAVAAITTILALLNLSLLCRRSPTSAAEFGGGQRQQPLHPQEPEAGQPPPGRNADEDVIFLDGTTLEEQEAHRLIEVANRDVPLRKAVLDRTAQAQQLVDGVEREQTLAALALEAAALALSEQEYWALSGQRRVVMDKLKGTFPVMLAENQLAKAARYTALLRDLNRLDLPIP